MGKRIRIIPQSRLLNPFTGTTSNYGGKWARLIGVLPGDRVIIRIKMRAKNEFKAPLAYVFLDVSRWVVEKKPEPQQRLFY